MVLKKEYHKYIIKNNIFFKYENHINLHLTNYNY